MQTNSKKKRAGCIKAALLAVFVFLAFLLPLYAHTNAVSASANSDVMTISRYDVDITVNADRTLVVKEQIVMTANRSGSKFRRSLPIEGDRYFDISAACGNEAEFVYYVEENTESEYIDIVCQLYTPAGQTRTYDIAYTMEIGVDDVKNGMRLDVIGFGWTVPLNDVSVTLHFPDKAAVEELYVSEYGSNQSDTPDTYTLSTDGKTLIIEQERLDTYINVYGERVAKGITVCFTFEKGVLDAFGATRIFTENMWKILLGGVLVVGLSVLIVFFTRKKRDMVTVVNITAPDNMDPLKMGKWLDGTADSEDVTSMIFYFANQGYLDIDLSNENNPVFIKKVNDLPSNAPAHQKTLFTGLFANGDVVAASDLKEKYYTYVDRAKMQVAAPKMYDKKSVLGFLAGGVLAVAFALLSGWLATWAMLGVKDDWSGIFFGVPVVMMWLLGYINENYRYKWKMGKRRAMWIAQLVIAALFSVVYIGIMRKHIFTGWEKFVVCMAAFASCFITQKALSRKESYLKTLGEIVGFKDFIVVTEEDRIKVMLEENPQLYYKILPYAQVLGVTDEWENKFKQILVEPPRWCTGYRYSVFDYVLMRNCMRRAMITAMARPQPKGGSSVGRSGGGGSFGGFGGGGHGGGGGSWS